MKIVDIWPKAKPDEHIKVGWRKLVRKTFISPDGTEVEYVTKDAIGNVSVAVLALTSDNMVITAKQFRPGPEKVMFELPGGGVEKSESYQDAAMRELREETGFSSTDITFLGKVYKDAYTNTQWHYYLAKDCFKEGEQILDSGEFVQVEYITIDQLFVNARTGEMTDPEAVFLAYENLSPLQKVGGK